MKVFPGPLPDGCRSGGEEGLDSRLLYNSICGMNAVLVTLSGFGMMAILESSSTIRRTVKLQVSNAL